MSGKDLTDKLKGGAATLGPTGNFPEGKLSQDDEGELRLGLACDLAKNAVVMAFGTPVTWLGLPGPVATSLARGLNAHAAALAPKFHKLAPDIPTDPVERKHMIQWLQRHDLWTYPVQMRVPPTPDGYFGEAVERGDATVYPMLTDGPDWKDEVHRIGGSFDESVHLDVVYVDPNTESIAGEPEDDDPRNSALRIWVEAGGWEDQSTFPDGDAPEPEEGWDDHNKWIPTHDYRLDCGGPDMETALLGLAQRVAFYYNEDGSGKEDAPEQCKGTMNEAEDEWLSGCTKGDDGYCPECGYYVEEEGC